MKKIKFKQVTVEKKGQFSDWISLKMTGYNMACCDCNLVHTINFQAIKIIKRKKGGWYQYVPLVKKDYQVIMKVRRNEKLTKQLRKK